jgi:hypothetical protein
MRGMKLGDKAFFYHSNCKEVGYDCCIREHGTLGTTLKLMPCIQTI